jgi:sensor histidine kinase YesM
MQKEKGGTVSISTKETVDAYYVVVEDDGVGLDRSRQ